MSVLDGVNIVRSVMYGMITIQEIEEQLDELIDISVEEFSDLLSPEEQELAGAYRDGRATLSAEELVQARTAYLDALADNRYIPRQLLNDVQATLDALEIAHDVASSGA